MTPGVVQRLDQIILLLKEFREQNRKQMKQLEVVFNAETKKQAFDAALSERVMETLINAAASDSE